MTGIRTGSRLEQLEALRRRLDHEIAVERRAAILAAPCTDHDTTTGRQPTGKRAPTGTGKGSDAVAHARLEELGVTTRQVKQWAVSVGLIPALVRGRVALPIIEKYAEAHQC